MDKRNLKQVFWEADIRSFESLRDALSRPVVSMAFSAFATSRMQAIKDRYPSLKDEVIPVPKRVL